MLLEQHWYRTASAASQHNGGVFRLPRCDPGSTKRLEPHVGKPVFLSFHYARDHWRVQQVRNIGVLDEQEIVSPQQWEQVKAKGAKAVENWIQSQMRYKQAVVVLVGAETANREWVRYEIEYAWNNRKPLVGIRINGLKDQNQRTDFPGPDPFAKVRLENGKTVADYVSLHTPLGASSQQVHASIAANLSRWIDGAYARP